MLVSPPGQLLQDGKQGGAGSSHAMVEQLVDEHPDACKPSAQVMADQADLVEVVHELHQVVNLKGT